jgi:hypothetical protein
MMTHLITNSLRIDLSDERIRFADSRKRTIFHAPIQPCVSSYFEGTAIKLEYFAEPMVESEGVCLMSWQRSDGQARLRWTFSLNGDAILASPIEFSCTRPESVESISLFAKADNTNAARPAGYAHRRIIPGIGIGPEISPIQHAFTGLNGRFSLGRGRGPTVHQQWGLPSHFFCVHSHGELGSQKCLTDKTSDTLCIGLLDFPNGDVQLELSGQHLSLQFDRHEQLGPQPPTCADEFRPLTPPLSFTTGSDSRQAMRGYYEVAIETFHGGVNPSDTWSENKRATAFATQSNTWGTEVAREAKRFTSDSLRGIYRELCDQDETVDIFVIDDKWESGYGEVSHCPERLPDFTGILDEIRADGRKIGLWAAFLRCEDPAKVGLDTSHMLQRTDGGAYHIANEEGYYIYDVTQPEVAAKLKELLRGFARRYRPDLVKFDFGYEIPDVHIARPSNPECMGERFFQEALRLMMGTLREELPDLVVTYYSLSPLMMGSCDQHSPDDLFMAPGDYAMEANRRFYFASVCAEFGMPLYGSVGYDWQSVPSIWFDALASGTIGSLPDPECDEAGEKRSQELQTLRSRLKPIIRRWKHCRIEVVGAQETGPITGCMASGWLRYENGNLVFAALRPVDWSQCKTLELPIEEALSRPTLFASGDGADIRTTKDLIRIEL